MTSSLTRFRTRHWQKTLDHWDSRERELLILVWVWTVIGLLDLAFFGIAGTARGSSAGPGYIGGGIFVILFWWAFRAAVHRGLNRRSRIG